MSSHPGSALKTGFNARSFYDHMGKKYDWFELAEAKAKACARDLVRGIPGNRLLNIGAGTGREHLRLKAAFRGETFALDLSLVMAVLSHRTASVPVCQADANRLPFAPSCFDVLYSAYMLDLLPAVDLPGLLREFWRVLSPHGSLILLGLTEGVDLPSRALVAAWKAAYAVSPIVCGGCRPLQVSKLVQEAGFTLIRRKTIVQLAVPSEVLLVQKCQDESVRTLERLNLLTH